MRFVSDIAPHNGWVLLEDDYEDSDGFWRTWYEAHHPINGRRIMDVSDFNFTMTQQRFNWFVDNDFPPRPNKGPWYNTEVDRRIANAPSP